MNIFKPALLSTLLVATFAVSNTAHAAQLTCGTNERNATFDPAIHCQTGAGNPKKDDITTAFANFYGNALDWTSEGELAGADNADGSMSDQYLTVDVTSGSWGSAPAGGTFAIADTFWTQYSNAVLSMHVGNGGGDPDWFAVALDQSTLSGTWDLSILTTGGGLSNMKLWGSGTSVIQITEVTEPAQLGILALGILGLVAARRRQNKAA